MTQRRLSHRATEITERNLGYFLNYFFLGVLRVCGYYCMSRGRNPWIPGKK